MNNLSLRLPEDLRKRLAAEAEREHKKRSEVAREAIADYLHRQDRDRFIAEFMAEAREFARDPKAMAETRRIQEEFDEADAETLPDEPFEKVSDWVRADEHA